ncbi:transposase family protein [Streptomyces sp. H27-H5]|uniref:transposase family protein n=1 Tax=Streptomyces sp. H27-H5 TaxID=2996460 RepID=UPI003B640C51
MASPSPTAPACGPALWKTSSPTPKASSSAWTAPRCRSDGPARDVLDARRSSRARGSRTPSSTAFSDGQGRTLFSGVVRPGRMHDQTAVRTEGIAEQLRLHPAVKAQVDDGYRGLANEFPDQITAPPRKPGDDAPLGEHHAWREAKRRQSSNRICIEHTNAEHKQWRPLQRYTGRRETYAETHLAITGLVSDRSTLRATRHKTSKELVLLVGRPVR